MISKKIQRDVANATVKLLGLGGQGILVKGDLIVTAAHCISISLSTTWLIWDEQGHMFKEEIETVHGKLKVALYAFEPLNDIAVLGPLDNQAFYKEAEEFEKFCEKVKPIPLFLHKLKYEQAFPVYAYTHEKTWVKGRATNWSTFKDSPLIGIDMEENIKAGTSGSPIVNEKGQLVAIMSNAGGTKGVTRKGTAPRPHLALPVWISRLIQVGHLEVDEAVLKKIRKIHNQKRK